MKTTLETLGLLGLLLVGCAKSTPSSMSVGGETNWLVRCSDAAACDQGSCLCGVCARECSSDRTCDGAFAGSCVATDQGAGEALCAEQKSAVPARVCLPRCAADADCGAGFDCTQAVCVPHADADKPKPNDAGPDGDVPDASASLNPINAEPDSAVGDVCDASDPANCLNLIPPLAALAQSLTTWNALVAAMGDTYSYAEENCLVNAAGDQTVTTIQVTNGSARLFGTTAIPRSECRAVVNRYDTFQPRTLPELYDECEALIMSDGSAVTLEFDDSGVIRACTYPGDSTCQDNCGEGFYLRAVTFGELLVP